MISHISNNILSGSVAIYMAISLMFFISATVLAVDIPEKIYSSGAVKNNSVALYLKGAIGQPAIQKSNSVSLYMKSGFYQTYMAIDDGQCYPGDANNDDNLNILDIVYLINYKYKDGPAPVPYEICSGDTDCDCEVNILDAVLLINYIYKSGLPPCNYTSWRSTCE